MPPIATAFIVAVGCAGTTVHDRTVSQRVSDPAQAEIIWSTTWGDSDIGGMTVTEDVVLIGGANSNTEAEGDWTNTIGFDTRRPEYAPTMVCLEAATGALRWRATHQSVTDRRLGFDGFPITSQAHVVGDRAYYMTLDWHLVCVDLNGFHDGENDGPLVDEEFRGEHDVDIIWDLNLRAQLGVTPRAAGDIGYVQSSPVVLGDLVFIVTGHSKRNWSLDKICDAPSFVAVDRHSGIIQWRSNAPGRNIPHLNNGSPIALPTRGQVVFPGGDGILYGFEATSGRQLWSADLNAIGGTEDSFFEARPAAAGGRVMASLRRSMEEGLQIGAPMIAINLDREHAVAWQFGKDRGGFWGGTVVTDNCLYAISAPVERDGRDLLHALDLESGEERWHLELGDETQRGQAAGRLIGGGDGLLVVAGDESIEIIDPTSGPKRIATLETWLHYEYSTPAITRHGLCLAGRPGGVVMLRLDRK